MKHIILTFSILLSTAVLCYAPESEFGKISYAIQKYCQIYNVDTDRAFVRFFNESSLRMVNVYEKKSKAISYGVTQICLSTARITHPHITAKQLQDIDTNIKCGVMHLRDLEKAYCGNWQNVVSVYMSGSPTKKVKFFKNIEQPRYEKLKRYQKLKERRMTNEKIFDCISINVCRDMFVC